MLKNYFLFVFLLSTTISVFAQGGASCYDPIDANQTANKVFTGTQNIEQWFTFTASQTGKIVVSSCDLTNEDTYVKVYAGGVCIPLILKAENDDHCSAQSKVSFIGTEGYDYLIVWVNKSSSESFNWSLTETNWQQGETCNDPILAVEGTANESDHSEATHQWFTYTPVTDGSLTISTCGLTAENTSVRIFEDCSGLQLTGNNDYCSEQSEVQLTVVKDQQYLIQWENNSTAGVYNWSLSFDGTPTEINTELIDQLKVSYEDDVLSIKLPHEEKVDIQVYNLSGLLVKTHSNKAMNVALNCSDLTQGIYIVQVSTGSGVFTQRVLIE